MTRGTPTTWSNARRVLCVRLDSLGDVLMMSPAIRAVRESAPGRHITLLTSTAGTAAARLIPEIDEVLVYDAPWIKAAPARSDSARDLNLIRQLQALGFDAAIVFTTFSQSPLPASLLCYLADIPLRLVPPQASVFEVLAAKMGWSNR